VSDSYTPHPNESPAAAAPVPDPMGDGIDRRSFLKCMAWVGTGLIWTLSGGLLTSCDVGQAPPATATPAAASGDFTFAQISDSHIGFSNDPNHDVVGTFQMALNRLNALATPPAFLIHTGDLSHLAKADEFDTLDQVVRSARAPQVFYVPGEHDVIGDQGRQYLARYGQGTQGAGWQSFDYHGVHFIGLVNVVNLKAGGMGQLGPDQLAWLKNDLAALSRSTPLVVFAHIPLWTVYPQWGWGTDDSEQALALVRPFGSVTVLNGHIHQVLQKVEGTVSFHTALSTAFPQPAPGTAPAPGPLKVAPGQLQSLLGVTDVNFVVGNKPLAMISRPLG
jgi:Icc protein